MDCSFQLQESGEPNVKINFRQLFFIKLDSIVIAATSVLYGIQIVRHPFILETYKVYSLIRENFDNRVIGAAFILFGLGKLIGIAIRHKYLKLVCIRGLLFLWLLFFLAFMLTPPPNTVWVFALSMVVLAIGTTIKEG